MHEVRGSGVECRSVSGAREVPVGLWGQVRSRYDYGATGGTGRTMGPREVPVGLGPLEDM